MNDHKRLTFVALFFVSVSLISAVVYVLVPDASAILSYSGEKFLSGEYWRLLTFPFTHVNTMHLAQNIFALLIAFFLALEISIFYDQSMIVFMAASLVVAIADLFFFPWMLIAGASVGVYAIFGALAVKGSHFLSNKIMIPLLGVPVIAQAVYSYVFHLGFLASALLHVAGFAVGGIVLVLLQRKPVRILEAVA